MARPSLQVDPGAGASVPEQAPGGRSRIWLKNNRHSILLAPPGSPAREAALNALRLGKGATLAARTANGLAFPTGMVRRVYLAITPRPEVQDDRVRPPWSWEPDRATWLHDFQRGAFLQAISRTRCVLRSPTGSGKGEIIAAICAAAPEAKILVLTPKTSLCADLSARIVARSGRYPFELGAPDDAPSVTVQTYDRFRSAWKADAASARGFDLLLADEAHKIGARMNYAAATALEDAYYRIGLSATPLDRSDTRNRYVVAALGEPFTVAAWSDLSDAGRISDFQIRWGAPPTISGVGLASEHDFARAYAQAIIQNDGRNALVIEDLRRCLKPAIVFADRVEHVLALESMARASGIRARAITGDTPEDERLSAIANLRAGKLEALVASKVFAEGVDVPTIRSVINAGGLKAPIRIVQQVGRGARVAKGKDQFYVYDYFDRFPEWAARHAQARLSTLEALRESE